MSNAVRLRSFWGRVSLVLLLIASWSGARAQSAGVRIASIDPAKMTTLQGSKHPLALEQNLVGHVPSSTPIAGMNLYFNLSASRQAELQQLLAALQDPASPSYRKWLTPAQYDARFGMSASDVEQVASWLRQEGFTVTASTPTHVTFSGTAGQVESAFQTELNNYGINGRSIRLVGKDMSLPSAVASVTSSIGNVSQFRPRPRVKARPLYSVSSSRHFLVPDDFVTIYDIAPLYNAGYTGTGETIAVVGQSEILASDVADFRSAAGLAANAPTFTLVPNTGTAVFSSDDEVESDLDVEWSGAIAKAATVNFIYVGNNDNYSVFDSLQYAIENDVAPVISISYGACEASFTSGEISTLTSWFEQANAQGQTIDAASGDNGAADCDEPTTPNGVVTEAKDGLAVDVPASTPYVTGVGGTEFLGDVASPSTYWNSTNGTGGGSAISYIPEEAWNDTDTTTPSNGLSGSGGGKSTLFSKPSWQTGTGVPADGARDVPDVALAASPDHDGYIYCNEGSCASGFGEAINPENTIAGGTSFGAPTFSGILTLIDQKLGLTTTGQGNINPSLYSIAAATPSAYHDITVGNNEVPCVSGSTDCGASGEIGYSTNVGYDPVTGWGSVDAGALADAFAGTTTPALIGTTTNVSASPTAPTAGTSVAFTATVAASSGTTAPTGTVQFAVNGENQGSAVTLTGSSSSGVATYTLASGFTAAGTYSVTAVYSGDSTHSASTGTLNITVGASSAGTASFSLAASSVTVAPGSTGTSTITVTPAGGFTGTVALSVSAPAALTNACFSVGSASVTGTTAATATLTVYTTESACATAGMRRFAIASEGPSSGGPRKPSAPGSGGLHAEQALALILLPFAALGRVKKARHAGLLGMLLLSIAVLGLTACGSSSTGTSNPEAPAGSYTLTVTGTNSSANLTETASLALTIS